MLVKFVLVKFVLAKFVLAKFVLAKFVLAKLVLAKIVLPKFVLVKSCVCKICVSEIRVSKIRVIEICVTMHIAMSTLFIITFSVMIIFSENIIQHISAVVIVATFHEELFGSGNFKTSDVVMNSTIILLITTLKFINVTWVVEFLTLNFEMT